jgi:hypothetical protein
MKRVKYDPDIPTIEGGERMVRKRPALKLWLPVKGGEGSGNFSHEGRPGEVGGSGAGGERIYYHGTVDKFAKSIQKHGILGKKVGMGQHWTPTMDDKDHVFVADDYKTAAYWAEAAVDNHGGKAVVIEVHIPADQASKLEDDPDVSNRYLREEKLRNHALRWKGNIPASWIAKVEPSKGW